MGKLLTLLRQPGAAYERRGAFHMGDFLDFRDVCPTSCGVEYLAEFRANPVGFWFLWPFVMWVVHILSQGRRILYEVSPSPR